MGGGGNSAHLHCKVLLFKQRGELYLRRENRVFFIAIVFFLSVVLEFPLERKTNSYASNHRDERSQWRETDFFKHSTAMTKYQGSLTALSKLKIIANDTVVVL